MICTECGKENAAGLVICNSCGAAIRPERHVVEVHSEQLSIEEARGRLQTQLASMLAASAVFFALAVAFRAVQTEEKLPRFPEIPAAPIFTDLAVHERELFPHPWLTLPLPETVRSE